MDSPLRLYGCSQHSLVPKFAVLTSHGNDHALLTLVSASGSVRLISTQPGYTDSPELFSSSPTLERVLDLAPLQTAPTCACSAQLSDESSLLVVGSVGALHIVRPPATDERSARVASDVVRLDAASEEHSVSNYWTAAASHPTSRTVLGCCRAGGEVQLLDTEKLVVQRVGAVPGGCDLRVTAVTAVPHSPSQYLLARGGEVLHVDSRTPSVFSVGSMRAAPCQCSSQDPISILGDDTFTCLDAHDGVVVAGRADGVVSLWDVRRPFQLVAERLSTRDPNRKGVCSRGMHNYGDPVDQFFSSDAYQPIVSVALKSSTQLVVADASGVAKIWSRATSDPPVPLGVASLVDIKKCGAGPGGERAAATLGLPPLVGAPVHIFSRSRRAVVAVVNKAGGVFWYAGY